VKEKEKENYSFTENLFQNEKKGELNRWDETSGCIYLKERKKRIKSTRPQNDGRRLSEGRGENKVSREKLIG